MSKRGNRSVSGRNSGRLQPHLAPFLLGVWVILGPVSARADIVADGSAPAAQQPTVLNAANGVPLVNIQTPSAAGVSRNTYSEFDVNANGAILNNSRTNAQTQLSGWVQANPWLATGSARVILNEVNASSPSQLNGFVEVAGSQAQVVIANPAGIACDGCGFINASRATLSAGEAVVNGGALQGYQVQDGRVSITGAGLSSGSAGYTDLIGRAVDVNAGVWAQNLNVAAGAGTVAADASGVTPAGGGAATGVAIDVSQLGGMYANSIHLVGTQAGVGVRNAGEIGAAAGQVTITADGRIENSGTVNGQQTTLAANTVANTGVIDGQTTRIDAATLDNTGSGRIYGDQISIGATTVNNVASGGAAPVIAGRERVDIGAQTINNREHGLIYSGGDMAIGGALDGQGRATGQADTLNNASATVEATGNLDLSVAHIANTNEHLSTDVRVVSTEQITEFGGDGSSNRYRPDQIGWTGQDRATYLQTPEGTFINWNRYDYTRTTTEVYVVETDPAQILAGGNINLNGTTALNENSRVIAGGNITSNIRITNEELVGERTVTDSGVVVAARRGTYCANEIANHCEDRDYDTDYSSAGYHPPVLRNEDDLPLLEYEENASNVGTGTELPDSSLYNITPDAPNGYLIETDPRFTDYRNWLSSDYMLDLLAVDPATTQMRLGDGFYEQQLIREQMADLTGRRFLDGYADEEAQYLALMNAGVTFAQTHELIPGVALTADQIAQLTSDIVWLVEEEIKLKDGTTAKVLVPRLYVMVRDGGINGNGALVSADNLRLEMTGDLVNTGTLASRNVLALTADNVKNLGGNITGKDVEMFAREDIDNLGGSVRAAASMIAAAGRDINVTTTSRTDGNQQGVVTHVDRVAGLYVDGGVLNAHAGRDLNLTGAVISNNALTSEAAIASSTILSADRDFMLNAVEEGSEQRIVWNKATELHETSSRDVGTRIQTTGDLQLQAGNNLTGTAAQIASTQGSVDVVAGQNIELVAGVTEQQIQSRGAHSRAESRNTTHSLASITGNGPVTLNAGNDVTLTGTDLQSADDVKISAQGDTSIAAVVDSEYRYNKETQSGAFGSSKTTENETLTSTVTGGAINAGGDLLINAHKNADGQIVSEQSGAVNLAGVNFQSGGDTAIAGDDGVTITGMQYETLDYHRTTETGKLGLSEKDEGSATTETRLQNANLTSGGNTHILSGADLTLAAADVIVNGDINLEAVDHLLIAAGEVLSSSKQWQNESRAFSGGDAYHSEEHASGERVTGAQASTLIAGGRVTARAGTGQVIGSDISGAQGVDLKSDAGDFVVSAAQTSRETYSHDREISVGFGDVGESLLHPEDMIKSKDGRLTFKIANAQYDDVDNKTAATDMRGSRIASDADVSIESSAGKVVITGSELTADAEMDGNGDVNLSGATGIDIGAATNTYSTQTDETHGSAEMSIVVQNQAVEVVMAYQRLEEAKEKLEESKRQYKDYQRNLNQLERQLDQLETDYANKTPGVNYDDLLELRSLVEEVKEDEQWYVAGIALAATNLVSATTGLIQQTAAAAQSTGTYGFNAGLQLDIDASQTDAEAKSTSAVASTLSGQNINLQTGMRNAQGQLITAGTATNIEGSNLLASNRIGITTGDLNVTASKNTTESSNETTHGHVTAQVTVYGAAGGASVNASFDRSKNSDRSTTYNNSNLLADKIDITTSGDTTIRGGNVRAESELNADIQGNLAVESVQNRSSSRNSSAGVSGGVSLGGSQLSGANGGFNVGNGMSSTRETVLTSLTSGGTANINVGKHTQITGAVIGTTDANGNDLNQLNLTTDTIGFADLRDTNISSQTSGGLSTNVGISGSSNTATNNTGGELLPGTTNLTYNNSQQNSASKSLATLGHGNITVGGTQLEQNGELTDAGKADNSALAGLNRDTSNTDKNLWSSDYSQEVDVTIDNRIFTAEGHKAIAEDVDRTERLGQAIKDVATMEAFELQDTLQHIDETQKEVDVQKAFALANKGKGIKDFQGASIADKQTAMATYAQIYADTFGVSLEDAIIIATDKFKGGTTYTENGVSSIAINDNTQNNALDYARTMGHEVTHARIHQKLTRDRNNDDLNEDYADVMGDYAADGMEFSAYNYANIQLNPNQSTNTRIRTVADNALLAANNEVWNVDVRRAEAGLGKMDYRRLSVPEAALIEQARVKIQESPNLTLTERTIMEKQLEAVACATVRCADGIPTDAPKYDEMKEQQERGERLMAEGVTVENLFAPDELEGKFEYTWVDGVNDNLTSSGETLYRFEAGTQAAVGITGVVGGISLGAAGATACGATVGASCVLVPAGAGIAALGVQEGAQGFDQLFSTYVYSEGQAVADSFYLDKHPGEINPAGDLAMDWAGLVVFPGVAMVAERYFLGSIDDVARGSKGVGESVAADESTTLSAAKLSSQWQGEYPYWGVDALVDSGLAKGDKIVQLTFRTDGVPTSSYFTTIESLQKAQVGGGMIDANILNQGLQTFPSGRSEFKLYAQVFNVGENIPLQGAARGATNANPYFNPSQVDTLEQIFILDEFKPYLSPINLIKLSNTKTPEYLPLDQVTNNMLRSDMQ